MKFIRILLCLSVTFVAFLVHADETESVYHVGVGDTLYITAFQHQEISGDFQIAEDGTISYPLIGQVHVSGKSVAAISALVERLLERDFFIDVQLRVEIREHRSRPVTVLGQVNRSGTYYLRGRTVLTEIIAEAGGIASSAGPEIELRRMVRAQGEAPVVEVFHTAKVMTGEQGHDVVLQPGDVISVSAKKQFFITGEVRGPGQYEISRGLTLMQAVSQAGGMSKFASQNVEIHREIDDEKVIETHDYGDIRKGRIADPLIRSGDIIIVRKRFF